MNALQISGRKTIFSTIVNLALRKNLNYSTNLAITYWYETILLERDDNRSVGGIFFLILRRHSILSIIRFTSQIRTLWSKWKCSQITQLIFEQANPVYDL